MRNIQLKRGNQVAAEFDLYDLLLSATNPGTRSCSRAT